jgi:hypothetical protein
VLLLVPHILWQIENHFPTFKYHLSDRTKPLRFWTVQNNITSQLLVAGPISGLIIFYSLTKFRINGDPFRKAMIFSILGFYIFFFIMSFKNRIEAHYTTAITPLLIIATYPIISNEPVLKKWFKRISIPVIVILFLFRFYIAADFLPNFGQAKIAFYNHKSAAEEVKQMADGKKVASFNNFAFPGIYEFYTGDQAIHMAAPGYRFCQFDLWDEETAGEGEPLFVYIPDRMDTTDNITLTNGRKARLIITPKFQSLKYLSVKNTRGMTQNDSLTLDITMINEFNHPVEFNHPSVPAIGFMQKKIEISATPLFQITGKEQIAEGEQISFKYSIPVNLIDIKEPIVIFTQTVERNRGKMFVVRYSDFR